MIILSLFMSAYVGATTLKFSEDFENYTTLNTTWHTVTSAWQCADNSNGACKFTVSSPGAGADAQQYIKEVSGNKFLHLISFGYSSSGYYWTGVRANFSADATIQQNWTIIFDMRVVSTDWSSISGDTTGMRTCYAGVKLDNIGVYPIANILTNHIGGGVFNGTQEDYERLRRKYKGTTYDSEPTSSACDINDGNWHRITMQADYSSSANQYNQTRIYIDGVLCDSSTDGINPTTTSGGSWKTLDFVARGALTIDIDNIKFYYGTATPESIYECADGIDNDGDGMTDYPDDPSCSSATDNTEAPYDYTQCNNGIDDDADGYIDLNDPSCDNLSDTSEFPKDASVQPENECIAEEFCLLREQFPYNDNISLHGWLGTTSYFRVVDIYGSNKMLFDNTNNGNIFPENFNLSIAIVNYNIYNNIKVRYELFTEVGDEWTDFNNYSFYINLNDANNITAVKLRYDLRRISPSSPDAIYVYVSYWNGSAWEQLLQLVPGFDEDSQLTFELELDQVAKTFRLSYGTTSVWNEGVTSYAWYNSSANKLEFFNIEDINFNADRMTVYIDNILITGNDVDFDTVCDEWDLPYYLKESFNGYLDVCDWVTSHHIYNTGQLTLTQDFDVFYAFKTLPTSVEDSDTRYVVLSFDLKINNITEGDTLQFRLYGQDYFNFFTVFFRDTGDKLWYDNDGDATEITNITLNQTINYKFVIDFQDDRFDVWVNGSKVASNLGFTDAFYNLEEIYAVKFASQHTDYVLDNISMYASDSNGVAHLPDTTITMPISNKTSFCGLFYKYQEPCTADEDCETGVCLPSHKCSQFDFTYCDENSMTRSNKCMFAGVASCILSSTADLILDNFLWFLVFLILLILVTYFITISRGR